MKHPRRCLGWNPVSRLVRNVLLATLVVTWLYLIIQPVVSQEGGL